MGKPSLVSRNFFCCGWIDCTHLEKHAYPTTGGLVCCRDEWKEFQKTIREDLHEVDFRQEAEEVCNSTICSPLLFLVKQGVMVQAMFFLLTI